MTFKIAYDETSTKKFRREIKMEIYDHDVT